MMPVSKKNFWYSLAKDYLSLPFKNRFGIGIELNLISDYDFEKEVEEIDEIIFCGAYKYKKVNEFLTLVQNAQNSS